MNSSAKATAVAYYRTSSAANVGDDKDSLKRQQDAVRSYAQAHGLGISREFYDAAVSGADPVMERPHFAEMLAYLLSNGARTVLVENASRFARDLAVQIAGHDMLKARGITLIPVDAPNHFLDETPTATMVRSILGAVSQFEKEALVLKLRKARDRKSAVAGTRKDGSSRLAGQRIEGARWVHDPARNPAAPQTHVDAAQAARAKGMSLRAIATVLAAQGMAARSGKPYSAQGIKVLLTRAV
jgi:DNA invertase Pin-like site-specific DNA recombinase